MRVARRAVESRSASAAELRTQRRAPFLPAHSRTPMSWPSNLPTRAVLWAVFAAIAVLWFANLGSRDLLHPDEGRYAEIAREMSASGDWVTPRLNGLKYFEKPPLQYWITAARLSRCSACTNGPRDCGRRWRGCSRSSRSASPVARSAAPRSAHSPRIALAGTLWHAGMAQIVSLDSGLAFFLALAFAGLVIAQRAGHRRRRAATMDVGHVGGDGGRHAVEGADRHRAARGRRSSSTRSSIATSGSLATAAPHVRARALSRPHRAVVHRGDARQRRVPARSSSSTSTSSDFLTEEHQRTGAW